MWKYVGVADRQLNCIGDVLARWNWQLIELNQNGLGWTQAKYCFQLTPYLAPPMRVDLR
jgi:hypothetical protein